jgi:hypothetical protein
MAAAPLTSLASVPNMIGDFFGGGGSIFPSTIAGSGYSQVAIAGGDRAFKISENSRPIPTDRVFFNFHHFHNAVKLADSSSPIYGRVEDLNRYTFGLEKTFHDGWGSVEVRIPFAQGLSATQTDGGVLGTEFGNVVLTTKGTLWKDCDSIVAAGLGVSLPTARDFVFNDLFGVHTVENEAVHLLPFLGASRVISDRWQVTSYAQLDFDANGNPVSFSSIPAGVYQDQTLLHLDIATSYTLYSNPCARLITQIRPALELHYTTTLENSDVVGPDQGITNPFNRLDVLNLTAGVHVNVTEVSVLTVAAVAPLRKEEYLFDNGFGPSGGGLPDAELTVQFNRFW